MGSIRITTIQLRRDTLANWEARNPILKQGEPGYITDTGVLKIGNGATRFMELPEQAGGGGTAGESAYEVAVNNGFVGSEQEWLESLQGIPGVDGLNPELRMDGRTLQWKYPDEIEWTDLITFDSTTDPDPAVTSVSFLTTDFQLDEGGLEEQQTDISILEEEGAEYTVGYESSDTLVATVNSTGLVSYVGEGTALITVNVNDTLNNATYTDSITVTCVAHEVFTEFSTESTFSI